MAYYLTTETNMATVKINRDADILETSMDEHQPLLL